MTSPTSLTPASTDCGDTIRLARDEQSVAVAKHTAAPRPPRTASTCAPCQSRAETLPPLMLAQTPDLRSPSRCARSAISRKVLTQPAPVGDWLRKPTDAAGAGPRPNSRTRSHPRPALHRRWERPGGTAPGHPQVCARLPEHGAVAVVGPLAGDDSDDGRPA